MLGCPSDTFLRIAISLRTWHQLAQQWAHHVLASSEELLVQYLAGIVLSRLLSASSAMAHFDMNTFLHHGAGVSVV